MPLGLVARSEATLDQARAALSPVAVPTVTVRGDAGDKDQLTGALDHLVAELGVPGVVVYNTAVVEGDRIFDLDHATRQARYAVNVLGALTTMAKVAPLMADNGGGTILVTGGMPHPNQYVVSLSIDKAGLRAAVQVVADQFSDRGVHVTCVSIGGRVAPGSSFDPDQIAEEYWRIYGQPRDQWQPDLTYKGSPQAAAPGRPPAPH